MPRTARRKVRTQVQIEPEVLAQVRAEARRRDVSTSQVVREALQQRYRRAGRPGTRAALRNLRAFAGCVRGDGAPVAREHDRYLHDAGTAGR